ncbi:endonuclease/exonuclease/phosphatase family protein [Actinomycetospora termitidis]|uniref:Endonuclease/exonuclease/phosphatase family protein n=1 Tax=Actinomycetospora termitidis TaxID=3053470 RepID=A0ABT7MIU2_9PSEU|nr:endonuclease/exonuclease/phosphatase family protein [Actinomycetospora sp. Odt1-22]MDL5159827.1 endonuclease/exonuclease/phosphatase family protein [Actinomycetospora sp. Odt1-22]
MRGELHRRGSWRAALTVVALTAAPWAWFALRDPLGLAGDVLAIVLPVLTVVGAGVLVWRLRRAGVLPAVSLLLAGTVAVVGPWAPDDAGSVRPGAAVTLAAANVTGMSSTVPALRSAGADVLVVSEDDPAVDAGIAPAYPFREVASNGSHVGVYSRFPLRLLEGPGPDLPGLRVAVAAPVPFDLIALHVPRPWFTGRGGYQATPAEHHRLVEATAARVARSPGPVVVAGDLNSTDRARDYRSLVSDVGMVDAMRERWAAPTQVTSWALFALRIDHVLVGGAWCGDAPRRFDLPRSDHLGVTAAIGPCSAGRG